ncbi:MAG: DUF4304 domain-containing protein [Firmicutes bacterium]|nr:DUF4304 domain-containing protein [Bacillota bacterium]MBQ9604397.1 DUF4304 domain-containing protein [Bacillota bacterium]
MKSKVFKRILKECAGEYGFKYIFQYKALYLNTEQLIIAVNSQKSSYSNAYYVNCGFFVKELKKTSEYPKVEECHILHRFSNYETEHRSDLFNIDDLEDSTLTAIFHKNFVELRPTIENGIKSFFESNPKAVCAAGQALKQYLLNQ